MSGNEENRGHWTGGQRESMAKLDPVEIGQNNRVSGNRSGSLFTQDLTQGFEPKYRGDVKSNNGTTKPKISKNDDPWAIQEMESTSTPWNELTGEQKIKRVAISIGKGIAVLFLLYFFVCSLDCLSQGFRLLGGEAAETLFQDNPYVKMPVVGVMLGILVTVLVQSSSTSTSIIVSMVSAGFLTVDVAIPIVMGANIGTSITNTIVSLTQAGDRNQFRRAFAGATVHDMFNWLSVITLLIIEMITRDLTYDKKGFLHKLTDWVMEGITEGGDSSGEVEILSVITDPFVDLIVQLDKKVMECWANPNCTDYDGASLLKKYCLTKDPIVSGSTTAAPLASDECTYLFAALGWNDRVSGGILVLTSLIVLCTCLILIVKVLQSVMKGQIANIIRTTLNAKIPYVPWITGYLAIGVGALMTFLVQSSSVFTSALTPLVGLGVISVERVYPLTLGSNIGTTTTALLAALAVKGDKFAASLQIALCHLFFNVCGILLFYPIPFMRFPIPMSKFLGVTTSKYRWFAIAYMIMMFMLLPGIIISLSIADSSGTAVIAFAVIIFSIFMLVLIISFIQKKKPGIMPKFMRSWKWLPIWFRSLEPYDRIFTNWSCCQRFKSKSVTGEDDGEYDNAGFDYETTGSADVNSRHGSQSTSLSMVHVDDPNNSSSSLQKSRNGNLNPSFTE